MLNIKLPNYMLKIDTNELMLQELKNINLFLFDKFIDYILMNIHGSLNNQSFVIPFDSEPILLKFDSEWRTAIKTMKITITSVIK